MKLRADAPVQLQAKSHVTVDGFFQFRHRNVKSAFAPLKLHDSVDDFKACHQASDLMRELRFVNKLEFDKMSKYTIYSDQLARAAFELLFEVRAFRPPRVEDSE